MLRPIVQILPFILLFLLGSCSSTKKTNGSKAQSSSTEPQTQLSEFEQDLLPKAERVPKPLTQNAAPELRAQRLVPLGFGSDGFPKIKRYVRENGAQSLLERIETDFNGDGRVDFIEWYDPSGQYVEREAADLGGNGRLNVVSFYKKLVGQVSRELIKQEFDAKLEGKVSVWKHYKNGLLMRREIDRNGRGRPDLWEYYEAGKLLRIERDENSDGIPDSDPIFRQVVKPQGPEPAKSPPAAR